jgi:DnaK suppressor protein
MPLTKQQLETLEGKLGKEKVEIEAQLAEVTADVNFGDEIDHLEEETDESEEIANRTGIKDAFTKRIALVDEAIVKLKNGTYGICERCGGEISFELLSVDPESSLCKNCKAAKTI